MQPDVHTFETHKADKLLIEGQFHKKRTERDHVRAANPRSLIFDTPSIFSHRHGVRGRGGVNQRTTQTPMVEILTNEGAESDKKKRDD